MIEFFHYSSYNDFEIRLYDDSFCDDRIYYESTQNNNINQIDQCYKLRSDESYERYLYKYIERLLLFSDKKKQRN